MNLVSHFAQYEVKDGFFNEIANIVGKIFTYYVRTERSRCQSKNTMIISPNHGSRPAAPQPPVSKKPPVYILIPNTARAPGTSFLLDLEAMPGPQN